MNDTCSNLARQFRPGTHYSSVKYGLTWQWVHAAHAHLDLSDLSAPLGQPGMRLVDWLAEVVGHKLRTPSTMAAVERGSEADGLLQALQPPLLIEEGV